MRKFRSYKAFLINLGIILILSAGILLIFFKVYLPATTDHGMSKTIPDITDKKVSNLDQYLKQRNFNYKINDSTYSPKHEPGVVLSQFPRKGAQVKGDRTIYIEVSSNNPPMVQMPDLTSSSLTNAKMKLKSYGLKVGGVKKVSHPDKNAVLKQYHHDTIIEPGTKIKKGTSIFLKVGSGLSNKKVEIPDLWGFNITTAKSILESKNLTLGVPVPAPDSDESPGTIVKQKPEYEPGKKVNMGTGIDVWVAGQKHEW